MAPFIHLCIDSAGLDAAGMLRDHYLGAARIEIGDDGVAVKGFVAEQSGEFDALDQRLDTDRVVALSRQ